jgi:hypothetical protein
MAVDSRWIDQVADTYRDAKTIPVEGVPLEMPVVKSTTRNTWQGLVSDDILPDSPNADAPEKIPFDILHRLTESTKTKQYLSKVLADDTEFAPLKPLFMFTTQGRAQIPVAFHVLAVKSVEKAVSNRGFKDKTFLLLMRNDKGEVDMRLVQRFIEHFRQPPDRLDLAQRTVLEQLQPHWSPASEFQFSLDNPSRIEPFVAKAGELLRQDLHTLLAAPLTRADFFRYTNQLLALHLGLYQPRLAAHINPAMDCLLAEMAQPGAEQPDWVGRIERGEDSEHSFFASLLAQMPEGATRRRMAAASPVLGSFRTLGQRLATLQFNLLLLNRVRDVVKSFLVHHGYDGETAVQLSRRPSQIIQRMQDDPDFRRYFERACEALAVGFACEQLDETNRDKHIAAVKSAPSGLHALRGFYQAYNLQSSSRAHNSRAYKQGEQVVRRLLSMGENGLLQARKGVGVYLEIGAGLLPLLLITSIGCGKEKIQVNELWKRLGEYGLRVVEDDRDRLLGRLKAMGLYERYSDAGEASYIRGLLTTGEAA